MVAVDTGNDKEGIRLEAKDGRNIAVSVVATSAADFSAATGVRVGLQVGTYSLETKVEAPLDITSSGDWTRAGIRPATQADAFNYNQNTSIDPVVGVGAAAAQPRHDALAHALELIRAGVEHLKALPHQLVAVGAEHLAQGLVAVDHDAVARKRQAQWGEVKSQAVVHGYH